MGKWRPRWGSPGPLLPQCPQSGRGDFHAARADPRVAEARHLLEPPIATSRKSARLRLHSLYPLQPRVPPVCFQLAPRVSSRARRWTRTRGGPCASLMRPVAYGGTRPAEGRSGRRGSLERGIAFGAELPTDNVPRRFGRQDSHRAVGLGSKDNRESFDRIACELRHLLGRSAWVHDKVLCNVQLIQQFFTLPSKLQLACAVDEHIAWIELPSGWRGSSIMSPPDAGISSPWRLGRSDARPSPASTSSVLKDCSTLLPGLPRESSCSPMGQSTTRLSGRRCQRPPADIRARRRGRHVPTRKSPESQSSNRSPSCLTWPASPPPRSYIVVAQTLPCCQSRPGRTRPSPVSMTPIDLVQLEQMLVAA